MKKYGTPVTFDRYVHLEHGPIPSAIKNLVDTATDDVDNSILADTIEIERPDGTEMYRILPRRGFSDRDKKLFSETELEVLEKVCKRFGSKNTQYIEDASHSESPWRETELLQEIPYSLAAKDPDSQATEEEIDLLVKIGR